MCGCPCRLIPRVYCLDPKTSSTWTHTHAILSQISQRVAMEQSRARLLPGSQKFRRYLHPMGQVCSRVSLCLTDGTICCPSPADLTSGSDIRICTSERSQMRTQTTTVLTSDSGLSCQTNGYLGMFSDFRK